MATQIKNMAFMLGAMLAAVISTPAFSAEPMLSTGGYSREMHKMEMMKMVDANGDHMVSIEEYNTYYRNLFDELDKNRNGALDDKEWVGVKGDPQISIATGGYIRELRSMKMMEMMDADKDHKVTKDEFLEYHHVLFTAMDKKGAKMLDPQDWLAKQTGQKSHY